MHKICAKANITSCLSEWKIHTVYAPVSDGKLYKSKLFQLFCSTAKTLSAISTICFTFLVLHVEKLDVLKQGKC